MESKILTFWIIICVCIWLLKLRPNSIISKAAFTWFGPMPKIGETYVTYQLRWMTYSFGWLCQFCLFFSILWFFVARSPELYSYNWFKVLWFALPFGIGISGLASLGFLFKALKANYFGPNPVWEGDPNEITRA